MVAIDDMVHVAVPQQVETPPCGGGEHVKLPSALQAKTPASVPVTAALEQAASMERWIVIVI
jgi:hypothetical protein